MVPSNVEFIKITISREEAISAYISLDRSSRSKQKLREKTVKIYANYNQGQVSKHCHAVTNIFC